MTSEAWGITQRAEQTVSRSASRPGLRLSAKERELLLLIVDLVLVNASLLASVAIWNEFSLSSFSLLVHAKWFATLSLVWLTVATVLDIYNLGRAASITTILASAASAALVSTLLYQAVPWLTPPLLHRSYVLSLVVMTTITIVGWRAFYARALIQPAFRERGLFVGTAAAARALARVISEAAQDGDANPFPGTYYEIVGLVGDDTPPEQGSSGILPLGGIQKLVRLARQYAVNEIILAPDGEGKLSLEDREILLDCRELGLRINSLASVYERLTGRLPVEYAGYDLQLLLSPEDSPSSRLYLASKRVVDVILALAGLAALGVILPLIALANALTSPGPLFYRQERLGKGGRPFSVIKLRSMVRDAERCSGAVWCGKDDPRITPVGRLLRKMRLDEVPQVINVLRGEMSFVGPRPERPHFVGQLARTFPLYRARHAVKPGITGWAQVHHEYGDSVEDARIKLEYDLYYVKHASLYLDLLTLLQTVRVVFGLKGR